MCTRDYRHRGPSFRPADGHRARRSVVDAVCSCELRSGASAAVQSARPNLVEAGMKGHRVRVLIFTASSVATICLVWASANVASAPVWGQPTAATGTAKAVTAANAFLATLDAGQRTKVSL